MLEAQQPDAVCRCTGERRAEMVWVYTQYGFVPRNSEKSYDRWYRFVSDSLVEIASWSELCDKIT